MKTAITYLSDPQPVSMGDDWYDIANADHFWIRRRFDIFRKLSRYKYEPGQSIAEVGCGHGLVQKQFETQFGSFVDGIDLNESALNNSVARDHPLYYYDVNERQDAFRHRYDQVILFDVVEHVSDPVGFLESVKYMVKPNGLIAINVPALQSLFSGYDLMAGHHRRYNVKTFSELIGASGLRIQILSYWGATLVPILAIRKLLFMIQPKNEATYRRGFSSGIKMSNEMLFQWSRLEKIPQRLIGSSLMAIVSSE
ncbi:class I SAM-dependent methyltransferase [Pseudomonadota bacterium]